MDDLISRQDAIDDLHSKSQLQIWDTEDVEVWINDLPSASPDLSTFSDKLWKIAYERGKAEGRKKGKWIERDDCWDGIYYECSVCKYSFEGTPSDNDYYFCPSCGSYNGGEEE